jgi:hypothetical protein
MKLNLFLIAIGVVLVTGSAGGATSLPPEAGLSDLLTLAALGLFGLTLVGAGVSFIKDSE